MALERNKKINPGYFQQVLDISNGLSTQQRQFIQKVINNIKKYNGAVTDKEYELLQRLKTGNFKYGIKNEARINWTPEKIKQAAAPYKSRNEFKTGDRKAYRAALTSNMIKDLFPEKLRTDWTPDEVKQAAAPYKSRNEFANNNNYAYRKAREFNMLDGLFPKEPPLTSDNVKQAAALYKSRTEFANNDRAAYDKARDLNMLDTLFPFKGEYNKVYIYVFKFSNKQGNPTSAYVGLTNNPDIRRKEHETGINRYKKDDETGVSKYVKTHPDENYEFELLTKEPLEVGGATRKELVNSPGAKAEKEWVEYFKNNGWEIINKRIGGADFGTSFKPKNIKNEVKNTSGNEILNKIIEKVYDTYSHALFMIHNSPIYPDDVYEMYMDTDPSNNLSKKWFDRNVIQNLERETKNPINHKTISDYVGKYIKNKAEKFNNRLK